MSSQPRKVLPEEERKLQRFLLPVDPVLALHPQLRNYFLTPAPEFGALVLGDQWTSLALYSTTNTKSFIHYYLGPMEELNSFRDYLAKPCQVFLQSQQVPGAEWKAVLQVNKGQVLDHPAYSGVFSRVAPRFAGTVYEGEPT